MDITPARLLGRQNRAKRRLSEIDFSDDEESHSPPRNTRPRLENSDPDSLQENEVTNNSTDESVKVSTPPARSNGAPIWNFFEKSEDNKNKAKCNKCKILVAINNGSTTMMMAHIKRNHTVIYANDLSKQIEKRKKQARIAKEAKEILENEKNNSQPKIKNFAGVEPYPQNHPISKNIDKVSAEYIVRSNSPLNTVEKPEFRKLIHTLDRKYVPPSRSKITRDIDEMRIEKEHIIKDELNEVFKTNVKSISFTSDGGQGKDRLKTKKNTLTAHYITEEFVLKSDTLHVKPTEGIQDNKKISSEWKEGFVKFGIINRDEKIHMGMTTDAAAPVKAARQKKTDHDMKFTNETDCFDHQICLTVEESLKNVEEISEALEKGHHVVMHINRSSKRREEFRKTQTKLGIAKPKELTVGTQNRWFHKYTEMKSLLDHKESVINYCDENEDDIEVPLLTNDNWQYIEDYCSTIEPFTEAVKMMGGEGYPTASCVIPVIDAMKHSLEERDESLEDVPQSISRQCYLFHQQLKANLEKRFPNGGKNKIPHTGLTLTDQRFMNMYHNEEEVALAIQSIIDNPIFDEERFSENRATPAVVETPRIARRDVTLLESRRKALLQKKKATTAAVIAEENTFEDKIKQEVKIFLSLEPIDIHMNPLKHWREIQSSFPLLAKYVKNNAHFQATSVASERIFNKDAIIYDPLRTSLLAERSETLTILQDFFTRREKDDKYELCKECPGNRNKMRIQCSLHKY